MSGNNSLDRELKTSIAELAQALRGPDDAALAKGKTLYHYTDGGGLLGIVEGRTFWASQADFLNDRMEVHHGVSILRDLLESRAAACKTGVDRDFYAAVSARRTFRMTPFIICFSEAQDSLPQWRGYGLIGSGYALGFDASKLGIQQTQDRHGFDLFKVIYDEDEQMRLLDGAIEKFRDWYGTWRARAGDRNKAGVDEICARVFSIVTGMLTATMKHSGFSSEQEWRLLSHLLSKTDTEEAVDLQHVRFRARSGRLIPYRVVPHPDLPLTHLTVGPTTTPDVAEEAARQLLVKNNIRDVIPDRSGVPLRD